MNNCTLPATGGSTLVIVAVAALVVAGGLAAVRWSRRGTVPVVIAAALALGVMAWAAPARAVSSCPPPTAPSTSAPTTTATTPTTTSAPTTTSGVESSTTTSTTTSTTSTTSTTVVDPAPDAVNDSLTVDGVSGSVNVLLNDDLGDPTATITSSQLLDIDTNNAGFWSFDAGNGTFFCGGGAVTDCYLQYTITNAHGSDTATVSIAIR